MHPNDLLATPPDIRLYGTVNEAMLGEFFRQQANTAPGKPAILELSTTGGNADIGRRIAHEIALWRKLHGQEVWFVGKSFVYSAGITIMSSILAHHRFMTSDCEILIHERRIKKSINLDGALRGCRSVVQDLLAEIDSGQRLEREGFADLVKGTGLGLDDVMNKVMERDWYLTSEEACRLGLIAGVL